MLWLQSDYQYTARMLIRSAGQMRLNGNPAQEAAATALAARAYAFLGDAVQAQTLIEFSLKLVCGLDNPAIEAMVFMCRAALYDQCGEWSQALADYAEAGRLAEQAGDLAGVYLTYCQQGRAHAMNADPQHGSEILEQALTIAIRRNINLVPAWPRAHLADCLVKLQQYDKAEPLCREAIRLAISSGDHYGQFSAQRTLAATLTYLHPQQPAAIHAAMHEAIRLQRQLGAQPELARSYIAYSRLLNVLGETEDAAEYLNQATGLCEQLHMSADLAEAIELLPANQLVS
jgi:tetratricopeptide (TPR) repeat protein